MIEYVMNINGFLFTLNILIHYVLLFGAVWSVAFPRKRIWPPPQKDSWQYRSTWFLFYLAFGLNAVFIYLDWNSWIFTQNARFLIGIPLVIIGALLVSWGVITLGTKNTAGIKGGFIAKGPYQFSRNPQYTGDMILFLGMVVVSNSLYVLIGNVLLILVFAITPVAEEVWLEKAYGEEYREYKRNTPRFL